MHRLTQRLLGETRRGQIASLRYAILAEVQSKIAETMRRLAEVDQMVAEVKVAAKKAKKGSSQ